MGAIVDTKALLDVVWASLVAGVGGTAAFSLGLLGATRFSDLRRDGRPLEAGAYGLLAALGLATCLGAVVFGVIIIVSK